MNPADFPYADAARLASVLDLLSTDERMRSVAPGWVTWLREIDAPLEAREMEAAPDISQARCWGRALTFDPAGSRAPYDRTSATFDADGSVYREGSHWFVLFVQIPGPSGYHMRLIREVLRACVEVSAIDPDSWVYQVGGSSTGAPGIDWRMESAEVPGFLRIVLRVAFAATAEV